MITKSLAYLEMFSAISIDGKKKMLGAFLPAYPLCIIHIAISDENGLGETENCERFNAFSMIDKTGLYYSLTEATEKTSSFALKAANALKLFSICLKRNSIKSKLLYNNWCSYSIMKRA